MANFRSIDKETIRKILAQMKTWLVILMYRSTGANIPRIRQVQYSLKKIDKIRKTLKYLVENLKTRNLPKNCNSPKPLVWFRLELELKQKLNGSVSDFRVTSKL